MRKPSREKNETEQDIRWFNEIETKDGNYSFTSLHRECQKANNNIMGKNVQLQYIIKNSFFTDVEQVL